MFWCKVIKQLFVDVANTEDLATIKVLIDNARVKFTMDGLDEAEFYRNIWCFLSHVDNAELLKRKNIQIALEYIARELKICIICNFIPEKYHTCVLNISLWIFDKVNDILGQELLSACVNFFSIEKVNSFIGFMAKIGKYSGRPEKEKKQEHFGFAFLMMFFMKKRDLYNEINKLPTSFTI